MDMEVKGSETESVRNKTVQGAKFGYLEYNFYADMNLDDSCEGLFI